MNENLNSLSPGWDLSCHIIQGIMIITVYYVYLSDCVKTIVYIVLFCMTMINKNCFDFEDCMSLYLFIFILQILLLFVGYLFILFTHLLTDFVFIYGIILHSFIIYCLQRYIQFVVIPHDLFFYAYQIFDFSINCKIFAICD